MIEMVRNGNNYDRTKVRSEKERERERERGETKTNTQTPQQDSLVVDEKVRVQRMNKKKVTCLHGIVLIYNKNKRQTKRM